MISFDAIRNPRLFEEICDRIRAQLTDGRIKPGDKLPAERDLAEQFGVSRPAVREALRALESAGLIELRKGAKGGAFMLEESAPLTQTFAEMLNLGRVPLSDFTEARILITEVVVRLACERATEADFAAMDQDVERLAAAELRGEERLDKRYITDFYDLLATSTGNQTLRFVTHGIAQLLSRLINSRTPPAPYDLADQRRKVLAALRARDAGAASALLAQHFDAVHHQIATALDL